MAGSFGRSELLLGGNLSNTTGCAGYATANLTLSSKLTGASHSVTEIAQIPLGPLSSITALDDAGGLPAFSQLRSPFSSFAPGYSLPSKTKGRAS
jgi:hypothetical protein